MRKGVVVDLRLVCVCARLGGLRVHGEGERAKKRNFSRRRQRARGDGARRRERQQEKRRPPALALALSLHRTHPTPNFLRGATLALSRVFRFTRRASRTPIEIGGASTPTSPSSLRPRLGRAPPPTGARARYSRRTPCLLQVGSLGRGSPIENATRVRAKEERCSPLSPPRVSSHPRPQSDLRPNHNHTNHHRRTQARARRRGRRSRRPGEGRQTGQGRRRRQAPARCRRGRRRRRPRPLLPLPRGRPRRRPRRRGQRPLRHLPPGPPHAGLPRRRRGLLRRGQAVSPPGAARLGGRRRE